MGIIQNITAGTNTGNETTTTVGTLINGATEKTTPVDADMVGLMDSAASNILKKLSWTNIKATLKAYFDTLYTLTNLGGVPTSRTVAGHALSGDVTIAPTDIAHLMEIIDGTTNSMTAGNYTAVTNLARQSGDNYWNATTQRFENLPIGKYQVFIGINGADPTAFTHKTGVRDLYNGSYTSTQTVYGACGVISRIFSITALTDTWSIQLSMPVTGAVAVKAFLYQL